MLTDNLWNEIGRQAAAFDVLTSHDSDSFSLLAAILAYYEAKGTSADTMLSPLLRERMRFYTERAGVDVPDPKKE